MATEDSETIASITDMSEEARAGGGSVLHTAPAVQERVSELVERARQGTTTDAEREELEALVTREHDTRMAKIRAHLTQHEPLAQSAMGRLPTALRREVRGRAHQRCEYCLIHEDDTGYDADDRSGCMVDLVVTEKHGGGVTSDNLAYLCLTCNRKRGNAATSLSRDGTVTRLYDPRQDVWDEHFRVEGYLIIPLTPIAEATDQVFDFNAPPRRDERRGLQLLGRYPVEAETVV